MFSSLGILQAVGVQHVDELAHNRESGLKLDDRSHWQQDLHQQGTHGVLDLLPTGVQEEGGTVLQRGDREEADIVFQEELYYIPGGGGDIEKKPSFPMKTCSLHAGIKFVQQYLPLKQIK